MKVFLCTKERKVLDLTSSSSDSSSAQLTLLNDELRGRDRSRCLCTVDIH